MKEIFKESEYEQIMTHVIERSRLTVQAVLDAWNRMEILPIANNSQLYELIWQPEIILQETVSTLSTPPAGLSRELQNKFKENFKEPNAGEFYTAADKARRDPYTIRDLSLFRTDGTKVILNTAEAEKILKSRSVYAETPEQERMAERLTAFIDEFNELNQVTNGKLLDLLEKPISTVPGTYSVFFNSETLKEFLQFV